MSSNICHFNVYLMDRKWTLADEFWSASDWGLSVGGIDVYAPGTLYNKAVRVKRMS